MKQSLLKLWAELGSLIESDHAAYLAGLDTLKISNI